MPSRDRQSPRRRARRQKAREPVRRLSQRDLIFRDSRAGITTFEEQISEQFAQRIEPVFHRDVLDAVIFAVGGLAHERSGFF